MSTAVRATSTKPLLKEFGAAKRDSLIPILQKVQEAQGYLSEEAIAEIGRHLKLPASKVYGVATFYNQFRFTPKGKYHVMVCRGTACHVKGSLKLLEMVTRTLEGRAGPDHPRRAVQPGGRRVHGRLRSGAGDERQRRVLRQGDAEEARQDHRRVPREGAMPMSAPETNGRRPLLGRAGRAERRSCWPSCSRPAAVRQGGRRQQGAHRGAAPREARQAGHLHRHRHLRPRRRRGQDPGRRPRATSPSTKIDAEVVEVGCIGMCSDEPMLDVQLPGQGARQLPQVTAEQGARRCWTRCSAGQVDRQSWLLGPVPRGEGRGAGRRCRTSTSIRSSPRSCAGCSPTPASSIPVNIDEYIARGGYSALRADPAHHDAGGGLRRGHQGRACAAAAAAASPPARSGSSRASATGDQKYLICNADEGDPGRVHGPRRRRERSRTACSRAWSSRPTPSAPARRTSTSAPSTRWRSSG